MTPERFLLPVQAMQLTAGTCAAIHEWVGIEHVEVHYVAGPISLPLENGERSVLDLAPGEWLATDGIRWWNNGKDWPGCKLAQATVDDVAVMMIPEVHDGMVSREPGVTADEFRERYPEADQ